MWGQILGANYVGKTTVIEILKKQCKSALFFSHPRFNDAQHYSFNYGSAVDSPQHPHPVHNINTIHVPRDVVYQISHMTCLKYLITVKDKKIISDRSFICEMVYNELYNKQIYHEFIDILKTSFDYKIFLLIVKDDEALKARIIERLKKDVGKGFGVRSSKGFVPDPETVEEKMKSQRMIEAKYSEFIHAFGLNTLYIDTSHKSKKEVAKIIKDSL